jgi:lysophospholipase L1-like esterase
VKPEDMIAGYRSIIARAHERGLRVYGATILPFAGAFYFTEAKERVRQAVNDWIRNAKEYDAVIDLDAALRDRDRPSELRREFDSGDHLHPNADGQRHMGEVIDVGLFAPNR